MPFDWDSIWAAARRNDWSVVRDLMGQDDDHRAPWRPKVANRASDPPPTTASSPALAESIQAMQTRHRLEETDRLMRQVLNSERTSAEGKRRSFIHGAGHALMAHLMYCRQWGCPVNSVRVSDQDAGAMEKTSISLPGQGLACTAEERVLICAAGVAAVDVMLVTDRAVAAPCIRDQLPSRQFVTGTLSDRKKAAAALGVDHLAEDDPRWTQAVARARRILFENADALARLTEAGMANGGSIEHAQFNEIATVHMRRFPEQVQ
jgi:hypothetical protein